MLPHLAWLMIRLKYSNLASCAPRPIMLSPVWLRVILSRKQMQPRWCLFYCLLNADANVTHPSKCNMPYSSALYNIQVLTLLPSSAVKYNCPLDCAPDLRSKQRADVYACAGLLSGYNKVEEPKVIGKKGQSDMHRIWHLYTTALCGIVCIII